MNRSPGATIRTGLAALTAAAVLAALAALPGCGDLGSEVPRGDTPPVLSAVVPDSGGVGDTVSVRGSGFGTDRSAGSVAFGGVPAGGVLAWEDTLVVVTVPPGASTGPVTLVVAGRSSNPVGFVVTASAAVPRSFTGDVLPRFTRYGCTSCHGGSGGLTVTTRALLLQGGDHGPAIIPGDAAGSLLIRKLSPTPPFGSRMPLGGTPLPDTAVQVLRDWIDQGAPDN